MKILWLTSWYPNKHDAFEGDFIQRQAEAASLSNDITVIYVNQSKKNFGNQEKISFSGKLEERKVYLKQPSFKWLKHWQYIKAMKLAIKKYIAEKGMPDIVHVHVPFKAGFAGSWMKRNFDLPLAVSEHWGIYGNTIHDDISKKSSLYKIITKKIFTESDVLITVSKYLGETICDAIVKRNYEIVPNVVDTEIFNQSNENKKNKFRFLHVSNLLAVKKPDLMLEAIKLFFEKGNDAEFVFIGNENDYWERKAIKAGLGDKVIFKGLMKHIKVAAEMKHANAFFLYSDFETFSCVTAEALCSGLPVIAPAVGALPELINAENGIQVSAGTSENLCNAFVEMINKYDLFDKNKIAKTASEKYNYSIVAQQLDKIYKKIAL